jgi:hypothetical protein
MIKNPTPELLV